MFTKISNVLLLVVLLSSSIAMATKVFAGIKTIPAKEEVKAAEAPVGQEAIIEAPVAEIPATDVVVAPEVPKEEVKKVELFSAEWFAWLGGMLVSIYTLLWLLGEGLTRVSVWTENKWDNKIAAGLSSITWFLGTVLGRFGYKLPKLMIEDIVEQAKEKDKKAA